MSRQRPVLSGATKCEMWLLSSLFVCDCDCLVEVIASSHNVSFLKISHLLSLRMCVLAWPVIVTVLEKNNKKYLTRVKIYFRRLEIVHNNFVLSKKSISCCSKFACGWKNSKFTFAWIALSTYNCSFHHRLWYTYIECAQIISYLFNQSQVR